MFECPRCHTQVPKWKSAIMTNFTKIKCENCGVTLKPDKQALSSIGGWGTVIGLPFAIIAMRSVGFLGLLFVLIVGFILACVATIHMTEFEVVDG